MNTKRFFIVLLTLILLLSTFAGCAKKNEPAPKNDLKVALDLTAEWDKVAPKGSLVQGCLVARKEFVEENGALVNSFLFDYKGSIDFLNENPKEGAEAIATAKDSKGNVIFAQAAVAEKAIPNCNVTYLDGEAMKSAMKTYLEALYTVAPASIGGSLPDNGFYYINEGNRNETASSVRVYTLNGTTGFGMAKLMLEDATDVFTVASDVSDVTAALLNGSADIAALPTNAAANLYNKSEGKIVVLAINTLGCLYLLNSSDATIASLADLKGKTVYVPAQNPTFILKYLLEANGLEVGKDVILDSESYAQPAALRDAVAAGKVEIAVLPEPMVTIARAKYAENEQAK